MAEYRESPPAEESREHEGSPTSSPDRKRKYQEREGRNGPPARRPRGDLRPLVKILVPDYAAGAVIGKKGATMREIEDSYKCKVKISSSGVLYPALRERVVVILGEVSDLVAANTFLSEIIEKHASDNGDTGRAKCIKLIIPNQTAGLIIGKGGEQIKALQEETGAKIIVNSQKDSPVHGERLVTISGDVDARKRACAAIIPSVAPDDQNKKYNGEVSYDNDREPRRDHGRHRDDDYGRGSDRNGHRDAPYDPSGLSSILGTPSDLAALAGGFGPTAGLGAPLQDTRSPVGVKRVTGIIEMDVSDVVLNALVCKNRGVFDEIMAFTKCSVKITEARDRKDRTISISGDLNQLKVGHALVTQKINEVADSVFFLS